jgi:hypothetical protein
MKIRNEVQFVSENVCIPYMYSVQHSSSEIVLDFTAHSWTKNYEFLEFISKADIVAPFSGCTIHGCVAYRAIRSLL